MGPRRRLTRCGVAIAALLLSTAACATRARFAAELPPELPDLRGWERQAGRTRCVNPAGVIDYELFVDPARPMVYSVTRYRVTLDSPRRLMDEKLQWDRNGRDVRRYVCAPAVSGPSCLWREFAKGSTEYNRELGALIAVFFSRAPGLSRVAPSPSASPR